MPKSRLRKKLAKAVRFLRPMPRKWPKPRRKIRVLFTCPLGEANSWLMMYRFMDTLKSQGFTRRDFVVRVGTTHKIVEKSMRLKGFGKVSDGYKIVQKPAPELIAQAQRYNYVIHDDSRVAEAIMGNTQLKNTVVMSAAEAGIYSLSGQKRQPFETLLNHIIEHHFKPAEKKKQQQHRKAEKNI